MVEEAIRRGLKCYCITDHFDYMFPYDIPGGFVFDPDEYFKQLLELKERYAGRIELNIGVEFGLRDEPGVKEKNLAKLKSLEESYPFAFIVGSTHLIDSLDPYYPEYWEKKTKKEALDLYFSLIARNLKTYDCYDSCGHLDYMIRYIPEGERDYDYADYRDLIDDILKTLIHKGKALEVNSAGLKYGLGFAHPKLEVLKRYRELGGELLTIGSDAHEPIHIAYGFDEAEECIKEAGFKYYTVYRERKPAQIPI